MKESYQQSPLPEKKSESTKNILGKISIGITATVASLGISDKALAQHGLNNQTKDKTQQTTPDINFITEKKFLDNKENNQDLSQFFNDDFISEVALLIKKDNHLDMFNLIAGKLFTRDPNSKDAVIIIDGKEYSQETLSAKMIEDINKEKKSLSNQDKEIATKRIKDLLGLVDEVKNEVIKHIKSNEYLEKISKEMNISKEKAKEYQNIRISNIQSLSLNFDYSKYLNLEGAEAYYEPKMHRITLPYDININDKKEKDHFFETLTHEVLHSLTRAQVSKKAAKIFKHSFKEIYNISGSDGKIKYDSDSRELIVRKQILDLEMEKLGIKKYGEKFTEDHYKKILELKKENKLSRGSIELIDHIKQENFPKIMNELAETKEGNGNYYSPEWNYKNIDNQV